jgi:hypothetical protein
VLVVACNREAPPTVSASSSVSAAPTPSSSPLAERLPAKVPLPEGYRPNPYRGPRVARLLDAYTFAFEDGRVFGATSRFHQGADLTEIRWLRGATRIWYRDGEDGCALFDNSEIRCWGDDTYGQIGSQPSCPVTWTALPEPPKDSAEWPEFEPESRRSVTCREPVLSRHALGATDLVLTGDGTCGVRGGSVWCWGQLDDNLKPRCPQESLTVPPVKESARICRVPRRMPGFEGIVQLVGWGMRGRRGDTCALDTAGSLRCRLFDSNGDLTERATAFWGGIRGAALGSDRVCVVLVGGEVQCTARQGADDGNLPRLGLGAPLQSLDIAIGATAIVSSEAPSSSAFCALLKDRTVACWGDNYGDTAVVIPGIHDVVELRLGDANACARTEAGAVYCWGVPVSNELGPVTPYVPVPPMPLVIPP